MVDFESFEKVCGILQGALARIEELERVAGSHASDIENLQAVATAHADEIEGVSANLKAVALAAGAKAVAADMATDEFMQQVREGTQQIDGGQ